MNVLGLVAQVGRNDLAIAWYQRTIAIDNRPPLLFNNMGEAYRAMGKGEEAIASYQAAIKRDPRNTVPRNNIAIVLALSGRLEMAMAVARVIAVAPDFLGMTNLGNASLDWGMPQQAAECHRHAMALAHAADVVSQQLSSRSSAFAGHHGGETAGRTWAWWEQHAAARSRSRFRCMRTIRILTGGCALRLGFGGLPRAFGDGVSSGRSSSITIASVSSSFATRMWRTRCGDAGASGTERRLAVDSRPIE